MPPIADWTVFIALSLLAIALCFSAWLVAHIIGWLIGK